MPIGADAVSAHLTGLTGLDEELAGRLDSYRTHLQSQPLATHTRRAYAGRVGGYLTWLAEADPVWRQQQGDPFTDIHARDYTVRDYRCHLLTDRRAKPASVNLTLAALDHFYRFLGVGPAQVRREDLGQIAPAGAERGGDPPPAARRRTRRAGRYHRGVRDRAILTMLLFTGLRIGELVALDRDDVAISARKGMLTARRGKGDRYRQVPLNAEVRDTLDAWLARRARLPHQDGPALFLSLKGQGLSARAIDLTVRHLGKAADVQASAHTLRHTCLTRLVRAGNDLVLVAELAGHTRLEATRRYSLPSHADRQTAMDALTVDY